MVHFNFTYTVRGRQQRFYASQSNENKQGYKVDLSGYQLTTADKFCIKKKAELIWKSIINGEEMTIEGVEIKGEYMSPAKIQELTDIISNGTKEVLEEMLVDSEISSRNQHKAASTFVIENTNVDTFARQYARTALNGVPNDNPTAYKKAETKYTIEGRNYFYSQKVVAETPLDEFILSNKKATKENYLFAVGNLAYRLAERGVNGIEKLQVSRVSHGKFNCMVKTTTGENLHCYSIIAQGPIIQPHLRYLIK